MAHNGQSRRGIGSGDIDMAGISTKMDYATRGVSRRASPLISGGINGNLFTYDKSVARQHDDDLDAALRSRGHPGMRLGMSKSQSTGRIPVLKAKEGARARPLPLPWSLFLLLLATAPPRTPRGLRPALTPRRCRETKRG